MKKIFLPFLLSFCFYPCISQTPGAAELHETAKVFMRQGDYANAILVLNRSMLAEPQNIAVAKDLALSYYFKKENTKALEVIKPVLERDEADDQCFQIAANIYKQLDMPKECEKLYKKGLKKFPDSGPLYNELGELQWALQDFEAIKQWEKGIETDPSYSKNYYNAAKYYFFTTDKVWSILYGEIFINMEPLSSKAPEIKQILLDSYKKLYTDASLEQNNKDKSLFVKAYLQEMNKQSAVAASGINTGTLSMIRTRFILNWYNPLPNKFAFRLFEYQQQLLKEGMFDAYNQWVFGAVENLTGYQNWISTHDAENKDFTNFQKSRIFKIPKGQFYH